jgi:hypothetical protein
MSGGVVPLPALNLEELTELDEALHAHWHRLDDAARGIDLALAAALRHRMLVVRSLQTAVSEALLHLPVDEQ